MPPFDLAIPNFANAGNIVNAMSAWMSGLTTMGELEWMGIITILLGLSVITMAISGASVEMARGKVGMQDNRR